MTALDYATAVRLVERGMFVAIAVGTRNGRPAAWGVAVPLDEHGEETARHPVDAVRAAQGLGLLSEIRRVAQLAGFTPA